MSATRRTALAWCASCVLAVSARAATQNPIADDFSIDDTVLSDNVGDTNWTHDWTQVAPSNWVTTNGVLQRPTQGNSAQFYTRNAVPVPTDTNEQVVLTWRWPFVGNFTDGAVKEIRVGVVAHAPNPLGNFDWTPGSVQFLGLFANGNARTYYYSRNEAGTEVGSNLSAQPAYFNNMFSNSSWRLEFDMTEMRLFNALGTNIPSHFDTPIQTADHGLDWGWFSNDGARAYMYTAQTNMFHIDDFEIRHELIPEPPPPPEYRVRLIEDSFDFDDYDLTDDVGNTNWICDWYNGATAPDAWAASNGVLHRTSAANHHQFLTRKGVFPPEYDGDKIIMTWRWPSVDIPDATYHEWRIGVVAHAPATSFDWTPGSVQFMGQYKSGTARTFYYSRDEDSVEVGSGVTPQPAYYNSQFSNSSWRLEFDLTDMQLFHSPDATIPDGTGTPLQTALHGQNWGWYSNDGVRAYIRWAYEGVFQVDDFRMEFFRPKKGTVLIVK